MCHFFVLFLFQVSVHGSTDLYISVAQEHLVVRCPFSHHRDTPRIELRSLVWKPHALPIALHNSHSLRYIHVYYYFPQLLLCITYGVAPPSPYHGVVYCFVYKNFPIHELSYKNVTFLGMFCWREAAQNFPFIF